jgi:hypothetical protein
MTHLPESVAADIAVLERDILVRRHTRCLAELERLHDAGEHPLSAPVRHWTRELESAERTATARGITL